MRLLLLLGLLASPVLAQNRQSSYRPVVGEPHTAFELPNIETGERVSLKNYRGKKVLLFHFASW